MAGFFIDTRGKQEQFMIVSRFAQGNCQDSIWFGHINLVPVGIIQKIQAVRNRKCISVSSLCAGKRLSACPPIDDEDTGQRERRAGKSTVHRLYTPVIDARYKSGDMQGGRNQAACLCYPASTAAAAGADLQASRRRNNIGNPRQAAQAQIVAQPGGRSLDITARRPAQRNVRAIYQDGQLIRRRRKRVGRGGNITIYPSKEHIQVAIFIIVAPGCSPPMKLR